MGSHIFCHLLKTPPRCSGFSKRHFSLRLQRGTRFSSLRWHVPSALITSMFPWFVKRYILAASVSSALAFVIDLLKVPMRAYGCTFKKTSQNLTSPFSNQAAFLFIPFYSTNQTKMRWRPRTLPCQARFLTINYCNTDLRCTIHFALEKRGEGSLHTSFNFNV